MNKSTDEFAAKVAGLTGRAQVLGLAVAAVCLWMALAWLLALPGVWTLAVHTALSVLLLLILFLVRRTHERQVKEIHRKLDDLVLAARRKPRRSVSLTDLSDEDLKRLRRKIQRLRQRRSGETQYTGNGHRRLQ